MGTGASWAIGLLLAWVVILGMEHLAQGYKLRKQLRELKNRLAHLQVCLNTLANANDRERQLDRTHTALNRDLNSLGRAVRLALEDLAKEIRK